MNKIREKEKNDILKYLKNNFDLYGLPSQEEGLYIYLEDIKNNKHRG